MTLENLGQHVFFFGGVDVRIFINPWIAFLNESMDTF